MQNKASNLNASPLALLCGSPHLLTLVLLVFFVYMPKINVTLCECQVDCISPKSNSPISNLPYNTNTNVEYRNCRVLTFIHGSHWPTTFESRYSAGMNKTKTQHFLLPPRFSLTSLSSGCETADRQGCIIFSFVIQIYAIFSFKIILPYRITSYTTFSLTQCKNT